MKAKQMKAAESVSARYQSNLRNIQGTFAPEGLKISSSTRNNLSRIAGGKVPYQEVLKELREKYLTR